MKSIHQRVLEGLEAMVENQGEGWFLIAEEPETESFVQFAFDEGVALIFDCPTISFNEDELERAKLVMGRFGIELEHPSGDDFASFNADMAMDIEKAADIATAMLQEVFMFEPETRLNITINR